MNEMPTRTIKKKFLIAEKASKAKGWVGAALGSATLVGLKLAADNANEESNEYEDEDEIEEDN